MNHEYYDYDTPMDIMELVDEILLQEDKFLGGLTISGVVSANDVKATMRLRKEFLLQDITLLKASFKEIVHAGSKPNTIFSKTLNMELPLPEEKQCADAERLSTIGGPNKILVIRSMYLFGKNEIVCKIINLDSKEFAEGLVHKYVEEEISNV